MPARLGAQVINNSWVGNMQTDAGANEVLRRLDYMIVRDNVFVANALDNTNTSPVHVLLAAAYDGLNVGISPGLGSTFTAQTTSSFRLMPDLVVPVSTTSQATAYVSGSAALLISEAKAHKKPVSALGVRASLMAGAQRLAGWRSTAASPLDPVQGAGQLRVDRSFDIVMGGELAPGGPGRTRGWDSAAVQPGNKLFYNITLARPATQFTAALIWNRRISDANVPFLKRAVTLANLDLQLQRKKGSIWVQVGNSFHTGDNLEFIAKEALIAGTYRLAVMGDQQETFAVAWYTDFAPSATAQVPGLAAAIAPAIETPDTARVVPEPTALLLLSALGLLCLRRRRNCL
ncbi:MAG: PEP-CTERM sorting domain-containing protein [Tepidisphaerales bacterium]